jgi:hypothetical protein
MAVEAVAVIAAVVALRAELPGLQALVPTADDPVLVATRARVGLGGTWSGERANRSSDGCDAQQGGGECNSEKPALDANHYSSPLG